MSRAKTNYEDKKEFSTTEVAKLLDMSVDRARNWLRKERALFKKAGRYYTTKARLMSAFPEAFDVFTR
jgi:phage antirepressor YoqD-like protein